MEGESVAHSLNQFEESLCVSSPVSFKDPKEQNRTDGDCLPAVHFQAMVFPNAPVGHRLQDQIGQDSSMLSGITGPTAASTFNEDSSSGWLFQFPEHKNDLVSHSLESSL